jgi:3-hydroxyacyl-CoA dehydrogenase
MPLSPAELRRLARGRRLEHVVVLGANGTMGYGSAALFTQAIPRVTLLARSREKAAEGLAAAIRQVRSPTVANRAEIGSYEELDRRLESADLVFEALSEDFALKKQMFDRVEKSRRGDAIVATVTSGLSIDDLAEGRSESFRRHFLGLHLFNPPNVIVGTELIAGRDTDPDVLDFVEAFARMRLGREIVRAHDTPAFAGNRIGFKLLNEVAQLAERIGPVLADRLVGPYTGRALAPLATIDLVGWDVHRAIVDNVHQNTRDEAHATLRLPDSMARAMQRGVLGNKSGGGFWKREGKAQLALDLASLAYRPLAEWKLPKLDFIARVAACHQVGRYAEGLEAFLAAEGEEAATARRVIAGYLSYAFHRVGEVCDSLAGIDLIMATGFNWAPPGALVDLMGAAATVEMIERAELPVPAALREAARGGTPRRFFEHARLNVGRFFVAN